MREPLFNKVARWINNWEQIYVQQDGRTVLFVELSDEKKAWYLVSWLEPYVADLPKEEEKREDVKPD